MDHTDSEKISRIVVGGIVASIAMMGLAYLLRAFGIDAPDFAAQYGAILNGQSHPAPYTGSSTESCSTR